MAGRWILHVSAASLLLLFATAPASSETSICAVEKCPNFRAIRFYEELGCVRSDKSSDCCPTRFDCSSLESLDSTKCHYNGKTYEDGTLAWRGIKALCRPACTCLGVREGPWTGEGLFTCVALDCAKNPIPEGKESVCYPAYEADKCCTTGYMCANDTKSPRNVTECVYNGKTYLEGQLMEETVSECMRCACQKGYDGTLKEPWCRRHLCEYTLEWTITQLRVCAPLFNPDDKCCAYDFHCPSNDDILVRKPEPSTRNEGGQCLFGDNRLNIGDELWTTTRKCVKCTCKIPPFITCEKSNECH